MCLPPFLQPPLAWNGEPRPEGSRDRQNLRTRQHNYKNTFCIILRMKTYKEVCGILDENRDPGPGSTGYFLAHSKTPQLCTSLAWFPLCAVSLGELHRQLLVVEECLTQHLELGLQHQVTLHTEAVLWLWNLDSEL
ncbi:hypothetical protein UY3_01583 [Chelonia mydas]|uniref:Uncharacterized protein n=1 Tax=Chelonia mydas TaxID=8469 RepID=M7BVD4_CHEMY|nr:hypothetical protein UY3_01583 [Chelonia mydas]